MTDTTDKPYPPSTNGLPLYLVKCIREGIYTAMKMNLHFNKNFQDTGDIHRRIDRALQKARKRGWIRYANGRWHLDKPPGCTEGLRITVEIDLEVILKNPGWMGAQTMEDAAILQRKWLNEGGSDYLLELLDVGRISNVTVEARGDLKPFNKFGGRNS